MKKSTKIFFAIFIACLIALGYWAFTIHKQRSQEKPEAQTTSPSVQSLPNDSTSDIASTDDLNKDNDADNGAGNDQASSSNDQTNLENQKNADSQAPKISTTPAITGSKLTNITPEHCNSDCKAFATDLKMFEYCQEACGISPIKNVSDCNDKKDLQKDYCLKDLAINKKDASACKDIKDASIKQTCKSRIAQDAIENLQ